MEKTEVFQLLKDSLEILSGVAMPVLAYFTFRIMRSQRELQARSLEIANTSNQLAHRSKQADVVIHANTRFDALVRAKHEGKDKARTFYMRFWSLQLDQFDAWEIELLPSRLYERWLDQRYADWQANSVYDGVADGKEPGSVNFRDGWDLVKKEWGKNDQRFVGFMEDAMIRYGARTAMDIHRPVPTQHDLSTPNEYGKFVRGGKPEGQASPSGGPRVGP